MIVRGNVEIYLKSCEFGCEVKAIVPKVSIIMPSLNVVDYIEKCMESVLGQTLEDIEVICIDADSTDGTHEILLRYAKKDSRVRLFRDDQHSTGYAKNLGIDMAEGEYVGIVEPDDYIETDMYERLYEAAVAEHADVVKCDYSVYVTLGNQHFFVPKKLSFTPADYGMLTNPQKTLSPFRWEMYTWAGIYRTDFLRAKNIRHHESKGAAYQDIGFWFQCFSESERVKLVPGKGYCYCQDNPEASVKNSKRLIRGLDELDWLRSIYDGTDRWGYLQPAWGLGVIRFVLMASSNLTVEGLHILVSRAREMLGSIVMNQESIDILLRPWEYDKYKLLCSSCAEFEMDLKRKKQSVQVGQISLREMIEGQDDLIIVSAGSHGANLQAMLKKNFNCSIKAFADNDKNKQGSILNGVPIISLEDTVKLYKQGFYLIANQIYGDRLKEQLINLGIEKDNAKVIFVDKITDTYL